MPYRSLYHFIETLEAAGELVRIKENVSPQLEIAEITDRVSKNNGPALLFENTGTAFPLLINSMGSEKRMAMALGVNQLDHIALEMESLFRNFTSPKNSLVDKLRMLPQLGEMAGWMPKVISGKGACQQIIMDPPDITQFPVLKCWPQDGGPFLTLPVIQTRDPHTGIRNVGLYRLQVFGPNLTAMHWHRHKVSARHFNEYKKLKQRMPVVVSLGGDPVYSYAATAPLPDGVDEFMLAGFIRKKSVQLVKCITQPMEVPADSDIVIEGYIDPEEDFILEGPFGDHTGYYSLADFYPRFHITCITHRKDAVYPATIVGIPPQEDAWIGKATERIFLAPIKMTMVPEIVDMALPVEGVFHNLVIVKIKKEYPGQASKVMHSLWGAGQMMFTKMMIVVDGDVNIQNHWELAAYVSENMNPGTDIYFTQGPVDVLDHSCSAMSFGGKMGIDATKKFPEEMTSGNKTALKPGEPQSFDVVKLMKEFPEIKQINTSLLKKQVQAVFIAIEKNRRNHVAELSRQLFRIKEFNKVKAIFFVEHHADVMQLGDAVWRFSNNLDPKRDHIILRSEETDGEHTMLVLDGTRKTRKFDGFQRQWPNILVSDLNTIQRIDAIWENLGLGPFLPSPSLHYRKHTYSGGAVATEES